MLLKLLTQLVQFRGQLDDYIRKRIANVFGIGDDDAFAVAQHDVSGNADDGGIGRNAAQYDGSRADAAVVADGDVPQQFGSRADRNLVADGGMPLALLF